MSCMDHFEYRVSVIIPVYNDEQYIEDCLDSMDAQTIDKSEIEVLLVDDGSTDKSLELCQMYAQIYPYIKVFTKENGGVAAARNFGMSFAMGKYIMFLDADDMLTPATIESVVDFFDSIYDDVDLVTYKIVSYKNGEALPDHFRYIYLNKSGIYDLEQVAYATQTTMNIVIKNDRKFFFKTDMTLQEDQEFICRVLQDKLKIGYCSDGEYQYNRSNESSATKNHFSPIELFEPTMAYFENLFAAYPDGVPRYYQAMFLNDVQWKVKSNILFPYHYDSERLAESIDRIKNLLESVDEEVIAQHPDIDVYHRAYWLAMKRNNHVTVICMPNKVSLVSNGNELYYREKIELVLYKLHVRNGAVNILLCAKSPVFTFSGEPRIFAIVQTRYGVHECIMDCHPSSFNFYKSREETNSFWTFYFEYPVKDLESVQFAVEIDGVRYQTSFHFMDTCPFNTTLEIADYVQEDHLVRFDNNTFFVQKLTPCEQNEILADHNRKIQEKNSAAYKFRNKVLRLSSNQEIWLYYDCKSVDKHNGYYQFVHDLQMHDGVLRYYVSANPRDQWSTIFNGEQLPHIIAFGSLEHKRFYLLASKIITAYIERENISPFDPEEEAYYRDLLHAEIIYLQHGILHAHLPWKYSPERVEVDRVVTSSYFENSNFTRNYGFRKKDLIASGMPCFMQLNRNGHGNTNRILFAPSWRKYLIGQMPDGTWIPMKDQFEKSQFFIKISDFLNNEALIELLEQNDLYLDFKLHPIFTPYQKCFTSKSDRIVIADHAVDDNDYAIFITDFSSYVFEFAYMKCPIIYFVPDLLQFYAGMNLYRQLDLPFEEAFGDLTENSQETVSALKKIINNHMQASSKYLERMNHFFLPAENYCEVIYRAMMGSAANTEEIDRAEGALTSPNI